VTGYSRIFNNERSYLALWIFKYWINAFCTVDKTVVREARSTSTDCSATLLSATTMAITIDIAAIGFAETLCMTLFSLWILGKAFLALTAGSTGMSVLALTMTS
jgi:hypothetical protein